MALNHPMNVMLPGYCSNRDADYGFNSLYSNGPVNNCSMADMFPGYPSSNNDADFGFNSLYSNGPVNNCSMMGMLPGYGYPSNHDAGFGFNSQYNNGPVNSFCMMGILPGYHGNRDTDFGFSSRNNNRPVNNYSSMMDMCCGPSDLLPPDPFGMLMPDPVNLLPHDPFGMGMNIHSSFNTAFSGLVGSLPINQKIPESSNSRNQETSFFAGFDNLFKDLKASSGDYVVGDELIQGFSYIFENESFQDLSEKITELNAPSRETLNCHMEVEEFSDGDESGGGVHEGMFYVLGYLGVRDLLNVKRVCKSLYQAVATDPLLWREIQIDSALSERITDQFLLEITQKAQGNLRSLSLVTCLKITDEGLRRVLELNPKLTKLNVPECARLNLNKLIENLKTLKSSGNQGIKHLKLGRLFSVSEEQYKELTTLLNTDPVHERSQQKPRFYHVARFSMSCDEDRALDLEPCPVCGKYKVVYDCPMESCWGTKEGACSRACESCVLRCLQCGRCIRDDDYAETFSFEYLCTVCLDHPHPALW